CTSGSPVREPTAGMNPPAVSKSGDAYVPNAIVPTAPPRATIDSGPGADGVGPFWRLSAIVVVGVTGKTVRSPFVPRSKLTGVAPSGLRIFSEIAVMLCVVKTLAAAMSKGLTPATNAPRSAERNDRA